MRRTAFTLLELILVLAIIISIAAMGIAGFQRQYARSQFKNGVVQLQIDLLSTRLVAMQSGTAYVFRYVPGSSVYEIAPLKTLQEALYRMNGDALDDSSDALGGSLSSAGGGLTAPSVGAVGLSSPTGLYGEPEYTDDLFSQENILADLKAASALNATMARQAASLGGSESSYGGSLQSPGGSTSAFDSSSLYESTDQPLGGLTGSLASSNPPSPSDPLASSAFGAASDFSGSGSEFALGTDLTGGIASETANTITVRDLTPYEKKLVDENTLAWRANADGAIIRKQTTGDVVFTFMRVSQSTPSNLRAHRPGGVARSSAEEATGVAAEGEDLGSALGGSLRSIPSGSGDSEGVGGGLNSIPGDDAANDDFPILGEEAPPVSMWSEPLVFYPNGKTSNATLGFACVGDYTFYSEIALRGMTGVARVSSISALPPGADPAASSLTQEQLFRLYHPGQDYAAGANAANPTLGGPLGGALGGADASASADITGGALGTSEFDGNIPDLSLDSLNTPTAAPGINYGSARADAGYGSQTRRSGYQFAETAPAGNLGANQPSAAQTSSPDVGLPQTATSTALAPDFGATGPAGGSLGNNFGSEGTGAFGAASNTQDGRGRELDQTKTGGAL